MEEGASEQRKREEELKRNDSQMGIMMYLYWKNHVREFSCYNYVQIMTNWVDAFVVLS